jgi:hypothetical protein
VTKNESRGASLSPIPIKGREVKAEFREEGQWADVTDASGWSDGATMGWLPQDQSLKGALTPSVQS